MGREIELSDSYSVPDLLVGKVEVSEAYQNYSTRGTRTSFGVDMDFPEMQLSKTLKSKDFYLLRGKIEYTMHSWEKKYQSHLDKQHKESRTTSVDDMDREAKQAIEALRGILAHTLDVDDAVDWDAIKLKDAFRIRPKELFEKGKQPNFIQFDAHGIPIACVTVSPPDEPTLEQIKNEYGFFSKLFKGRAIIVDFEKRLEQWHKEVKQTEKENLDRAAQFKKAIATFEKKKIVFEKEKQRVNEALEDIKSRYSDAEAQAVEEYCDLVLNNSEYPDYFPKNWVLEYREESRLVVLDYHLPRQTSSQRLNRISTSPHVMRSPRSTWQRRCARNCMTKCCIRFVLEPSTNYSKLMWSMR